MTPLTIQIAGAAKKRGEMNYHKVLPRFDPNKCIKSGHVNCSASPRGEIKTIAEKFWSTKSVHHRNDQTNADKMKKGGMFLTNATVYDAPEFE